eukprot:6400797-Heterocapsa_arctica.AAC.1
MDPRHHGRSGRSRDPHVLRIRLRQWEAGPRKAKHGVGPGSVWGDCRPRRGSLDCRRRLEQDAGDDR